MAAAPRSSFHGAAGHICLLLLIFLWAKTTSSSASGTTNKLNGSCIAAERDALLSFKAGITSDPSTRLRSWRGQDCCRWYGVKCSTRTVGHVVKLDLRNDFLVKDVLDDDDHVLHWLGGQISSSLLSLSHLKHLDLSGNRLGRQMPIPEFIGSLKSLTYLNLSYVDFNGRIPPHLGNLTKLVNLDIQGAYYSYGNVYSSDISWLSSLQSLKYLDMSDVNLSTAVDWVHAVNTLPNLRALYLYGCELNSSIPSLLHHNLTVLEKLDLSQNFFNSPAAPNWYWDVTSLKSLKISNCELSGPFPAELGNLTMIENLYMQNNNIKGMIPSTLENLCNLRMIYLGGNDIGGDIADLIERIPKCSWNNLRELDLFAANITGSLKSVLNLTALKRLDISKNHLHGSVPIEIGTLKFLTSLSIGHNNLSGVISEDHLSGLMNLKFIDLSYTHLHVMVDSNWKPPFNLDSAQFSNCHLGLEIPNWLEWQSGISALDISNASLIGRIPDWFWTTFSNATYLKLSYNQFRGELPHNLEFMRVKELLLQSNRLTGSVPILPRNIELLDISKNSLNGQLPSNFGAQNLQFAILFSNHIIGIIPDSVCLWPQLVALDLSNNLLTGGLPDCGREEMKQQKPPNNNSSRVNSTNYYSLEIRTLLLSNNNLSGGFPLFLKQCQNLMYLDLTQNKFSGQLPAWISENMPRLVMLRLKSNNFFGHIPLGITRLISLCILDLANNTFSGVIPQSIVNLKALSTPDVVSYQYNLFYEFYTSKFLSYGFGTFDDTLSMVVKGQVLEYRENAIYLMSIDLSCNRLGGQIPEEFGSLLGLINLNLSWNFLSGSIPNKICNLKSLESLDLSNNQLSGEIPWRLSNLTSLSYLNLSYNNLSGRIPSGNQLDILRADDPTSMYIGNPGLCGHPLPKVCPGDQPTQEDQSSWYEDDNTQMEFHLGLTMGLIVVLWIVFCCLLFKKTWRNTYFSLLDKLCDKVCT